MYDDPSRDHVVDANLLTFLNQHPGISPENACILDIGCGTGKQVAANRTSLPKAMIVGVDLFIGMLNVGKKRCQNIYWIQGDGACIPFLTNTFDYVSNQYSYPHMQNKEKFIHDVLLVLKPSGRFVMTNIDPWSMTNWILYRFFPAAKDLDFQDFFQVDRFVDIMHSAGFINVQVHRESRVLQENLIDFLQFASDRHRTSHFIAISDIDYYAGIQRLEQAIAQFEDESKNIESEFCRVTIRGDKPNA